MENKKTFGGYVKLKRAEAGLTQRDFAEKLYVTESAVSKWERGLSYPDITLIAEICRILNVSEHELLTASEDTNTRNQEKLAKRYLSLIKRIKIAQVILYGIPILTCFIVNLAVSGTLSWFFIVLSAEAVAASLTLLPVFVEKNRGLITLAGFSVSLIALLIVCRIYAGGNWLVITIISVVFGLSVVFMPFVIRGINLPAPFDRHKALINIAINTLLLFILLLTADIHTSGGFFLTVASPIAAFFLILPWSYIIIIRYANINGFLKSACCLAVTSVIVYFRDFVNIILGIPYNFRFARFDFSDWNSYRMIEENVNAIIFLTLAGLAIAFAAAGAMREIKLKSKI